MSKKIPQWQADSTVLTLSYSLLGTATGRILGVTRTSHHCHVVVFILGYLGFFGMLGYHTDASMVRSGDSVKIKVIFITTDTR